MTDRELSREEADRVVEVEAEVRDNDRKPVSDIADVLAGHMLTDYSEVNLCECGWGAEYADDDRTVGELWRAHVVALLEPLIRAREKAAWDEGYQAAYGMARGYGHTDHWEGRT